MYKTDNRFLYWVVYFPLGINIGIYFVELLSNTFRWFRAEPDSVSSSTQYVFLGRDSTLDEFLQTRLFALMIAVAIGSVIWLYEHYFPKKENKF